MWFHEEEKEEKEYPSMVRKISKNSTCEIVRPYHHNLWPTYPELELQPTISISKRISLCPGYEKSAKEREIYWKQNSTF